MTQAVTILSKLIRLRRLCQFANWSHPRIAYEPKMSCTNPPHPPKRSRCRAWLVEPWFQSEIERFCGETPNLLISLSDFPSLYFPGNCTPLVPLLTTILPFHYCDLRAHYSLLEGQGALVLLISQKQGRDAGSTAHSTTSGVYGDTFST
jgi:hypothetical protein